MKTVLAKIAFMIMLFTFVITGSSLMAVLYWGFDAKFVPPAIINVVSHSEVVTRGQPFTADLKIQRLKGGCEVKINRWVYSKKENVETTIQLDHDEIYIDKTDGNISLDRKITASLEDIPYGSWDYEQKIYYFCNQGNYLFGPSVIKLPSMHFVYKKG